MIAAPSLAGAFLAGLLSFFTPCCLPMVPVYLAYLAGERRSPVGRALLFCLGFTAVFVALGASATVLGRLLLLHRALARQLAGVVLVALGLNLAGVLRLPLPKGTSMLLNTLPAEGPWRPLLLGLAFSAGWQPCIGPVLGGILLLAGTQASLGSGVALLLVYSLGLALPFLLAAASINRFREWLPALLARSEGLRRVSGWLLVLMGFLVYLNLLGRVGAWFSWRPPL